MKFNSLNSPIFVPLAGLSLFAIASGYLMSLIPLSLTHLGLPANLAPWLASIFYLGLLIGTNFIEPIVAKIGHCLSLIIFLFSVLITVLVMAFNPDAGIWLVARFIAGIAIAGIFVVVESWLLIADTPKQRAKRLSFYMIALYGGGAIGQLGVSHIGVEGIFPYLVISILLFIAILPSLISKKGQPEFHLQQKVPLNEIKAMSKPAIVGCLVSGLTLGPIYGLLPIFIREQTGNANDTGLLMSMVILGGMMVQPIVGYLSPKINKSLLMAAFSLLGLLAIFLLFITKQTLGIIIIYTVLGASVFALYPIAISLACEVISSCKIVSATQIMLLSYSVGSILGPVLAIRFSNFANGLLLYLGFCLTVTTVYMLVKSAKTPKDQQPLVSP